MKCNLNGSKKMLKAPLDCCVCGLLWCRSTSLLLQNCLVGHVRPLEAARQRVNRMLAWMLLVVLWLPLCGAQTAYIIPSLQQDVPSNHSYMTLSSIVTQPDIIKQYDVIMLTTDYRVRPQRINQNDPVVLMRNLTITSANVSSQGYRLLELEFLTNRLLIPQGLSLTLKDLALGRARRTAGQGIPFFVGEGDRSYLILKNVVRIRTACAHNEEDLVAALQSISRRSPGRNDSKQQEVLLAPTFSFRGRGYADAIHAIDLRYFVGPVDVPDTTYYAGYSMLQMNTTRICETYVSDECVAKRGADVCVNEQIDKLAAAEAAAAAAAAIAASRRSDPPATNVAAIVAPIVVSAFLVLAGVGAVWFLVQRRRSRAADSKESLLPVAMKQPPPGSADPRSSSDHYGHQGSAPGLANPDLLPGPYSGAVGSIESLAIGNRAGSWQLAAFHAAPEFADATPHDQLRLGLLLGAGSFGRVYKGSWRGMDVAVKVLQQDSSTAAAIANEVDLVMSFRHPNIVAAYYFVTWTRSTKEQDGSTGDQVRTLASSPCTAVGSWSTPGSQQQLLSGPCAVRGQLEPVAEASTPTTRGSSAAQSGAVASSVGNRVVSSSSNRVSFDGRSGLTSQHTWAEQPQTHDAGGTTSSTVVASCGQSSCSSSAGNSADSTCSTGMVAVVTGSASAAWPSTDAGASSSSLAAAAGSGSAAAGILLAPLQPAMNPWWARPGKEPTKAGWGQQQQHHQQQQPTFVPILPGLRTRSGSSSSSELAVLPPLQPLWSGSVHSVQDNNGSFVQLVPFTTSRQHTSSDPQQQHLKQQQQQQQVVVSAGQDQAAYEVSICGTSRAPSGARETASSSAGGTSSSLIAAAYSQQQLLRNQQASSDGGATTDQQVSTQARDQLQPYPPQQQQQQQRYFAVGASASSPSDQGLLSAPWGNNTSSSTGPSSGKAIARSRGTDEAQAWLVCELCDGGTLLDLLAEGGALGPHVTGRRRMVQVLTLLVDIAAGMSYLHSRNVLHGDLKPCNVLIKHVQGAPYCRVAKVSDFGLSRALQAGQSHRSTRTFGTLNHTPPELLRLGRLSPAGDVYAYGIMMWEAFTGQVAFSGLHYGEVFEQVALLQQRPEIPPGMPGDYAELVTQCWAADPLARPPFTTVKDKLEALLSSFVQDEAEAQERFVSDL